jgi:hypothetical protein
MNAWKTGFSLNTSLVNPPGGGASKGATSMFDPLSAGITAAGMGLQGLFGAITGNNQAKTMASIANAQMAAQADAVVNAREIQKGNLGMGMFNTIWGSTTGSDLEFGRQLAAKRAEFAEFLPKQMGLGREQARWQTAFELSPDVRELSRKERMGRLQETIAGYQSQPTGMFGPIGRINIEALAG